MGNLQPSPKVLFGYLIEIAFKELWMQFRDLMLVGKYEMV